MWNPIMGFQRRICIFQMDVLRVNTTWPLWPQPTPACARRRTRPCNAGLARPAGDSPTQRMQLYDMVPRFALEDFYLCLCWFQNFFADFIFSSFFIYLSYRFFHFPVENIRKLATYSCHFAKIPRIHFFLT